MKNTTRQAICAALVLSAVSSVSAAVFVATVAYPDTEGTTVVEIEPEQQYAVIIPATVTAAYGSSYTDFTIKLESAFLEPDATVSVNIKTKDSIVPLTNNDDITAKIFYTVQEKNAENAYVDFVSCDFKEAGEQATLAVAITAEQWQKAPSGKYTGGITFTIRYNTG